MAISEQKVIQGTGPQDLSRKGNGILKPDPDRRKLMAGIAGLLFTWPVTAGSLLAPTPRQSAGPFYPVQPPLDDDNDLTLIRDSRTTAQGRITDLFGRVVDRSGRPLQQVRIEIWQCDAYGRYHHPRDRGPRAIDKNFQGFGHTITDENGSYRFRTIRPVPYPGRTPHIHMVLYPVDAPPFITQLYIKGEPRNARDFLFKRIPKEQQQLVLAEFTPTPANEAEVSARFDITLGGTNATPTA